MFKGCGRKYSNIESLLAACAIGRGRVVIEEFPEIVYLQIGASCAVLRVTQSRLVKLINWFASAKFSISCRGSAKASLHGNPTPSWLAVMSLNGAGHRRGQAYK